MAVQAIETIKGWFRTGRYPTQAQFWDWMDSYFHKNSKIPPDSIEGIEDFIPLTGTPAGRAITGHLKFAAGRGIANSDGTQHIAFLSAAETDDLPDGVYFYKYTEQAATRTALLIQVRSSYASSVSLIYQYRFLSESRLLQFRYRIPASTTWTEWEAVVSGGNSIPLSGTEENRPVTGPVEVTGDFKIGTADGNQALALSPAGAELISETGVTVYGETRADIHSGGPMHLYSGGPARLVADSFELEAYTSEYLVDTFLLEAGEYVKVQSDGDISLDAMNVEIAADTTVRGNEFRVYADNLVDMVTDSVSLENTAGGQRLDMDLRSGGLISIEAPGAIGCFADAFSVYTDSFVQIQSPDLSVDVTRFTVNASEEGFISGNIIGVEAARDHSIYLSDRGVDIQSPTGITQSVTGASASGDFYITPTGIGQAVNSGGAFGESIITSGSVNLMADSQDGMSEISVYPEYITLETSGDIRLSPGGKAYYNSWDTGDYSNDAEIATVGYVKSLLNIQLSSY